MLSVYNICLLQCIYRNVCKTSDLTSTFTPHIYRSRSDLLEKKCEKTPAPKKHYKRISTALVSDSGSDSDGLSTSTSTSTSMGTITPAQTSTNLNVISIDPSDKNLYNELEVSTFELNVSMSKELANIHYLSKLHSFRNSLWLSLRMK